MTYVETLWYPDFEGLSYFEDQDGLLLSPYFLERGKAVYVSNKIEEWNQNFINFTFIEVKNNEYEIACYQTPQASKPSAFGLYRSGMNQNDGYKNYKDRFQENLRLQIMFIKDLKTSEGEPIGPSLKIKKVERITEDNLLYHELLTSYPIDYPYVYENIAHLMLMSTKK
jgi:hypothetical protein